jgi:hypothetical protein
MAKSDAARLRPLLAAFLVGYAALSLNSYAFFFTAPVVVELLIAGCIGGAIFTANSAGEYALASKGERYKSAEV